MIYLKAFLQTMLKLVSPHSKGTFKKNDKSKFRPIKVLATFSEADEEAVLKLIGTSMKKPVFQWRNFSLSLILFITKRAIAS